MERLEVRLAQTRQHMDGVDHAGHRDRGVEADAVSCAHPGRAHEVANAGASCARRARSVGGG
eukprot:11223124-Lingulodinium_polyedra.AAC.1